VEIIVYITRRRGRKRRIEMSASRTYNYPRRDDIYLLFESRRVCEYNDVRKRVEALPVSHGRPSFWRTTHFPGHRAICVRAIRLYTSQILYKQFFERRENYIIRFHAWLNILLVVAHIPILCLVGDERVLRRQRYSD